MDFHNFPKGPVSLISLHKLCPRKHWTSWESLHWWICSKLYWLPPAFSQAFSSCCSGLQPLHALHSRIPTRFIPLDRICSISVWDRQVFERRHKCKCSEQAGPSSAYINPYSVLYVTSSEVGWMGKQGLSARLSSSPNMQAPCTCDLVALQMGIK